MKPHHILKSFNGSQTGNDFQQFVAGTTEPLSKDLAAIAVKEGWAKPVDPKAAQAPDPTTRETKVTGPDETKPVDIAALNQKELLALAKEAHGLELKGNTSKADILKAIEAAQTPDPVA